MQKTDIKFVYVSFFLYLCAQKAQNHMKRLLFILLSILSVATLYADRNISGIVVDAQGEPIIGASVLVDSTSIGTITDIDGQFVLTVPESATTMTVSYIGMQTLAAVGIHEYQRLVLTEQTEMIQEVVVTGYGNISRGSFAGSAATVSSESVQRKAASEFSRTLMNEVAGVQVVGGGGQPGSNATIMIRGVGSINATATPLYVVDDAIFDGEISSISPSDITSVTILKDATATALYGSRGANGVIVITTKRGEQHAEAEHHIDVDVMYGGNMHILPGYETIDRPEDYVTTAWSALYTLYRTEQGKSQDEAVALANQNLYNGQGLPQSYNLWDKTTGANLINPYDANGNVHPSFNYALYPNRLPGYENIESWADNLFRVGHKAEANLRLHGGSDKIGYYTSLNYVKDEGYYRASDFNRFSTRVNLNIKPYKWMRASFNIAYAFTDKNDPDQSSTTSTNGFYFVNLIPPIYPVFLRNADGSIATDPRTGGPAYDFGNTKGRPFQSGSNPAASLLYDKQNTRIHNLDARANFEFLLYKGLKLKVNVGTTYTGKVYSELTNNLYGASAGIGRLYQQSTAITSISAQQMLDYSTQIGNHSIMALAGHETYFHRYQFQYAIKSRLGLGTSLDLSNAIQTDDASGTTNLYTMDSYLARVEYIYDERYGITANYRADGSSRYAPGHRWGHFGSVGAMWNFTSESFMKAAPWLRNGKLHYSWGVLGNQITSLYSFSDTYTITNINGEMAYVIASKGNPNLTWERTSTHDVGISFGLTEYVDLEFDYFYKLTDNMLFNRSVPPSLGYSSMPSNDAKMMNQGQEFAIRLHPVNKKNITLDISINGTHYSNKMLQMPIQYIDENGVEHRLPISGGMSVGHSNMDHYTYVFTGLNDKGQPTHEVWYDKSKGDMGADLGNMENNYIPSLYQYAADHGLDYDKIIAGEYPNIVSTISDNGNFITARYIGKSMLPDLEGGIGMNLGVYGVNLNISCGYRIGGYGYDVAYKGMMDDTQVGRLGWHKDMLNAWTEWNKNSTIPSITNGQGGEASNVLISSTRFLTSNSYFSLNNISLSYDFPKELISKAYMKRLNIYISASNLAIATARKGYNPTVSFYGNSSLTNYSPLSSVVGGVKVEF